MVLSPTEHLDSAKISSNGFKFSTIVFRVYIHVLIKVSENVPFLLETQCYVQVPCRMI